MKETIYKLNVQQKYNIALLSDTHNEEPSEIIESLSSRNRRLDFIAISGDFVLGHRPINGESAVTYYKNVLPLIASCTEIAPTYISMGNHEWMLDDRDVELLEDAGAVVLDNSWVRLEGQNNILIGGLTSSVTTYYQGISHGNNTGNRAKKIPHPNRASRYQTSHNAPSSDWLNEFESQPGYKVLLSHHPEYWRLKSPYLANRNVDLVLSGHAHGGQFRFFEHGIFAPGQGLFPKYTSGVHTIDIPLSMSERSPDLDKKQAVCRSQTTIQSPRHLIISRGLSNTAPLIPRLFNPTEVVYVEAE